MAQDRRGTSLPPWIPTALVGVLVVLVVLIAPSIGPWEVAPRDVDLPAYEEEPVTLDAEAPGSEFDDSVEPRQGLNPVIGQVILWTLIAAGAVLLIWIAIALWRQRRRLRFRPDDPGGHLIGDVDLEEQIPVLQRAARSALDEIAAAGDPTDAIIRAWLALEDAAGESGVPRRPTDTPTDLTVKVLRRTAADPVATQGLLRLYHRARFGTQPMAQSDQAAAVGHLRTLADTWSTVDAAAVETSSVDASGGRGDVAGAGAGRTEAGGTDPAGEGRA